MLPLQGNGTRSLILFHFGCWFKRRRRERGTLNHGSATNRIANPVALRCDGNRNRIGWLAADVQHNRDVVSRTYVKRNDDIDLVQRDEARRRAGKLYDCRQAVDRRRGRGNRLVPRGGLSGLQGRRERSQSGGKENQHFTRLRGILDLVGTHVSPTLSGVTPSWWSTAAAPLPLW